MFKTLRIVFCIISALLIAACVFVFVYAGPLAGVICLVAAGVFFALTLFFKHLQEEDEAKKNPPPAQGDFFHPVHKDGEDK